LQNCQNYLPVFQFKTLGRRSAESGEFLGGLDLKKQLQQPAVNSCYGGLFALSTVRFVGRARPTFFLSSQRRSTFNQANYHERT
jgi:hypothetical protein